MHPPRKILLNPGPATTSQAVKEALIQSDICPREKEFGDLMHTLSEDLVAVVGGHTSKYAAVLFGGSGTAAMEACISSLVPEGKHILIIENGAYGTRLRQIAEVYGIPVVSYKIPYGDYPDIAAVEELIKGSHSLSHIFMVHHETTTGMLNPIQKLAELAWHYKMEVVIDAMSSLGGIPIDVKMTPYEYIISSSNKCLQGMPGLAFVVSRKEALLRPDKKRRSFYLDLPAQYQGFQNTHQMPFTPPVQVAYALEAALQAFFAEGQKARYERYRRNFEILYAGLQKLGFAFLLPRAQESEILLAVREPAHPAYAFDSMHDYLFERGFTIYPGKGAREATFRLSVLGDLHPPDIEAFLHTLALYLRESGIENGSPHS